MKRTKTTRVLGKDGYSLVLPDKEPPAPKEAPRIEGRDGYSLTR